MCDTVLLVVSLILLCGDVETNPGPTLGNIKLSQLLSIMTYCIAELTVLNALEVLSTAGFNHVQYWYKLGAYLKVPLEERRRLKKLAKESPDCFDVLEEMLDWWITNNQPSWEALITSVERCGDTSTADNMWKHLELGK